MISAVYLVDSDMDSEWIYELQFNQRIFQISTPEPWANLSWAERIDMISALHQQAFEHFTTEELSTRPSDKADKCMDQAIQKDIRDSIDEDEDEDYDSSDFSDIPTQDLWDELERRRRLNEPDTE